MYISGAVMYATRIPERCHPGRFDHFGSSHQIFHVMVLLAAITHYFGCLRFYEWRIMTPCPLVMPS